MGFPKSKKDTLTKNNIEAFINKDGKFSLHVMVIVDENKLIQIADVNQVGSRSINQLLKKICTGQDFHQTKNVITNFPRDVERRRKSHRRKCVC